MPFASATRHYFKCSPTSSSSANQKYQRTHVHTYIHTYVFQTCVIEWVEALLAPTIVPLVFAKGKYPVTCDQVISCCGEANSKESPSQSTWRERGVQSVAHVCVGAVVLIICGGKLVLLPPLYLLTVSPILRVCKSAKCWNFSDLKMVIFFRGTTYCINIHTTR